MRVGTFVVKYDTVLFTNKDTIIGQTWHLLNSLPVTPLYSVDKIFQCNSLIERVCMYSNSRNDVPRVAQRYGTIASHTRAVRPSSSMIEL